MVADRKKMKKENLKVKSIERSFSLEPILNIKSNEVHSKSISKGNFKKKVFSEKIISHKIIQKISSLIVQKKDQEERNMKL